MAGTESPFDGCAYVVPEGTLDAMAPVILSGHTMNHRNNKPSTERAEKVKRPSITSAGTSATWDYFIHRWSKYSWSTKLGGQDLVIQLLECCDEQLRIDLTRNQGGSLAALPVGEVLTAIRTLAVREENVMVARVALHNMRQDREEPVRAFGARLRGQAAVCKFIKCGCGCEAIVDYSKENVADVLCIGLADTEIQRDLLKSKGTRPKRPDKDSESQVPGVREDVQELWQGQPPGKGVSQQRSAGSHPVRERTVQRCVRAYHARRPQSRHPGPPRVQSGHRDVDTASVETSAVLTTGGGSQQGRLRPPGIQPGHGQSSDHDGSDGRHGMPELPHGHRDPRQAGPDLISVTLTMRAANGSQLKILGAVILRLSNPKTNKNTRQMVYVTPSVTKLFISQEACADLGIIKPTFPNSAIAAVSDMGGTLRAPSALRSAAARDERGHHPGQRPHRSQQQKRTGGSWRNTSSTSTVLAHSTRANTNHSH